MRSKENAQDYRYFPDPDLPPVELSEAYLEHLRSAQPELAPARMERYQRQFGLPAYGHRDAHLPKGPVRLL